MSVSGFEVKRMAQNGLDIPTSFSETQRYFKCIRTIQDICFKGHECIETTLTDWHEAIKELNGKCRQLPTCRPHEKPCMNACTKKPSCRNCNLCRNASCNACQRWTKDIQKQYDSNREPAWMNVTASKFYSSPVEVAKMFVFQAKAERMHGIKFFKNFDARSVLMIMKTFKTFVKPKVERQTDFIREKHDDDDWEDETEEKEMKGHQLTIEEVSRCCLCETRHPVGIKYFEKKLLQVLNVIPLNLLKLPWQNFLTAKNSAGQHNYSILIAYHVLVNASLQKPN